MFQPIRVATASRLWRPGKPLPPRVVGLLVALVLEALLLALLFSLGARSTGREPELTVVSLKARNTSEAPPAPEPEPDEAPAAQAAPATPSPERPAPRPALAPATLPVAAPPPPAAVLPVAPRPTPVAEAPATPARPAPIGAVIRGEASGPPNRGSSGDTQRVGTAPNGEPLYAAAWYREPYNNELAGYLSSASGPGWGLIACKTVPDFRVEDCALIAESPAGSNIGRSVLAAAWQFRVRPPRRGGQVMVGSWVRIRIDYGQQRRP